MAKCKLLDNSEMRFMFKFYEYFLTFFIISLTKVPDI